MATVTTDRHYRQLLTTSLAMRSREIQDLVFNSRPVTAILRERGAYRPYYGPEIRVPLLIDKLTAQWFTGYDKLRIEPKELLNSAVYTPKRVTAMFSLTGTDLLANEGRAKIIDLMELYLNNAEETMRDEMEASIHGAGTGNGGRQMIGLGGALPILANTGTYGGIDRAANPIWRTTTYNIPAGDIAGYTTWDSTTARDIISQIALTRSMGNRYPKLWIADPISYRAVEQSLVAHQRIVNASEGAAGRLGFRALEIMTGAGPVEVVAAGGIGSVMPANTIYAIDTDGMAIYYHPNNNMVPVHDGDGAKPINQDAIAQGLVWTGELVLDNPRFQVRITTA